MQRASVTADKIVELVSRLYGLQVTEHRKLASYDDINFLVKVAMTSSNKHLPVVSVNGYVLKILNTEDSKKAEFLDAKHAALEVVYKNGIMTSLPVPNITGSYYTIERLATQSGNTEDYFLVRLFEFVPGETLEGKPYTPELCYQVGQLGGKIDRALKDFDHPMLSDHKRYWSLTNIPNLTEKCHVIDDADKNDVIRATIERFKEHVVPFYGRMKTGTIHADLNPENIIVTREPVSDGQVVSGNSSRFSVHGIIDFGDMVREYPVFELGIALSYMMTYSRPLDPVDAGGHVLAGYLSQYDIPPFDLERLKEVVEGRLSQSLVNGIYAYKQTPDNAYCLESSQQAWPTLKTLNGITKGELYSKWQTVLAQYGIDNPFSPPH